MTVGSSWHGSWVWSRPGLIIFRRFIMKWFLRSFSSLPLNHSRRAVVSYKRKSVHKVLVNRLFKLAKACPGKNVVRWTDSPAMTIDMEHKATKTNKQSSSRLQILWDLYWFMTSSMDIPLLTVVTLCGMWDNSASLFSSVHQTNSFSPNTKPRSKSTCLIKWYIQSIIQLDVSHNMRFQTIWYVLPAKAQTSLHISTVWSELLLVLFVWFDSLRPINNLSVI